MKISSNLFQKLTEKFENYKINSTFFFCVSSENILMCMTQINHYSIKFICYDDEIEFKNAVIYTVRSKMKKMKIRIYLM